MNTVNWVKAKNVSVSDSDIHSSYIDDLPSKGCQWYSKIECHANTEEEAIALRDFVLKACQFADHYKYLNNLEQMVAAMNRQADALERMEHNGANIE